MTGDSRALTSNALLVRNVGVNLVGWTAPALVGLVAVPLLVSGMGDARFGLLTLIWTAIGYFTLFDLGIGRALTHAVAGHLGRTETHAIGAVTWTAIGIIVPVSLLGSTVLFAATPLLAHQFLKVPPELQHETVVSFRILAGAIPFTAATAALRGVLEAKQRFGAVNALRLPYGILTFLAPLAALPLSESLVPGVALLSIGRVLLFAAHVMVVRRLVPEVGRYRFDATTLRPLLTYGGWMTVSNIVSPVMNTLDRFVVGAALTVSQVAYYATPNEVVTKLWLFTAALLPVVFPAFATSVATEPMRTATLFDRALRVTLASLFLPTLVLVVFANEVLTLWLGAEFAIRSATVMQVLAVAVFINTIGQGAFTLIQGLGRPDLTGKFHLTELPLYALLLWILLPRYGILGVAVAWAVRAAADSLALLIACPRVLPQSRPAVLRIAAWLALAVPALAASAFLPTTMLRLAAFVVAAPAWCAIVWLLILTPTERAVPTRILGAMLTAR